VGEKVARERTARLVSGIDLLLLQSCSTDLRPGLETARGLYSPGGNATTRFCGENIQSPRLGLALATVERVKPLGWAGRREGWDGSVAADRHV